MKLTIEGVGKRYKGDFWGLRDFSLELEAGVLGLLGPNGAGKSTLMRILATITRPTEGRVLWDGVDVVRSPDRLRGVLGYGSASPRVAPLDYLGAVPQAVKAGMPLAYLAATVLLGLAAVAGRKRQLLAG